MASSFAKRSWALGWSSGSLYPYAQPRAGFACGLSELSAKGRRRCPASESVGTGCDPLQLLWPVLPGWWVGGSPGIPAQTAPRTDRRNPPSVQSWSAKLSCAAIGQRREGCRKPSFLNPPVVAGSARPMPLRIRLACLEDPRLAARAEGPVQPS